MSTILTNELDASTQFVMMKTDYYNGEPLPRMLQPGWSWGGAHQSSTYPATVPGMRENLNSQVPRKRWPKDLVLFYRDLNYFNLEYAFRVTNGNINNSDPSQQIDPAELDTLTEMPKFEVLTYVGNTHVIKEITDKGVALQTLDFDATYYDSYKVNYKTSVYVAKFSAIRADGLLFNMFDPPDDNYMPLVSYDVFFIPFERAELYPPLGDVIVTSGSGLNIRDLPGIEGEKVGALPYGTRVTLKRYFPTMGNVWGRIEDGWIALRYQPYPGYQTYYEPTTWKLETAPPPRPYRELPEFDAKEPTYNFTNQKMINIFYSAASQLGTHGWPLIEKADLTYLAIPDSNRTLMYTGPKIEDIATLTNQEKEVILSLV
jgi:hypothetical protein